MITGLEGFYNLLDNDRKLDNLSTDCKFEINFLFPNFLPLCVRQEIKKNLGSLKLIDIFEYEKENFWFPITKSFCKNYF